MVTINAATGNSSFTDFFYDKEGKQIGTYTTPIGREEGVPGYYTFGGKQLGSAEAAEYLKTQPGWSAYSDYYRGWYAAEGQPVNIPGNVIVNQPQVSASYKVDYTPGQSAYNQETPYSDAWYAKEAQTRESAMGPSILDYGPGGSMAQFEGFATRDVTKQSQSSGSVMKYRTAAGVPYAATRAETKSTWQQGKTLQDVMGFNPNPEGTPGWIAWEATSREAKARASTGFQLPPPAEAPGWEFRPGYTKESMLGKEFAGLGGFGIARSAEEKRQATFGKDYRTSQYYGDIVGKMAGQNPVERSSWYHAWGEDTGLPQAPNVFEHAGDFGLVFLKGGQEFYKGQLGKVNPATGEMLGMVPAEGLQGYLWEQARQRELTNLGRPGAPVQPWGFTAAINRVEKAQGEMGPYGKLGTPTFATAGGGILPAPFRAGQGPVDTTSPTWMFGTGFTQAIKSGDKELITKYGQAQAGFIGGQIATGTELGKIPAKPEWSIFGVRVPESVAALPLISAFAPQWKTGAEVGTQTTQAEEMVAGPLTSLGDFEKTIISQQGVENIGIAREYYKMKMGIDRRIGNFRELPSDIILLVGYGMLHETVKQPVLTASIYGIGAGVGSLFSVGEAVVTTGAVNLATKIPSQAPTILKGTGYALTAGKVLLGGAFAYSEAETVTEGFSANLTPEQLTSNIGGEIPKVSLFLGGAALGSGATSKFISKTPKLYTVSEVEILSKAKPGEFKVTKATMDIFKNVEGIRSPIETAPKFELVEGVKNVREEFRGTIQKQPHSVFGRTVETGQMPEEWIKPRGYTSDVDIFTQNPELLKMELLKKFPGEFQEGGKGGVISKITGKHAVDIKGFQPGYPIGTPEAVKSEYARGLLNPTPSKAGIFEKLGITQERLSVQTQRKATSILGEDVGKWGPLEHRYKDIVDTLRYTSYLGESLKTKLAETPSWRVFERASLKGRISTLGTAFEELKTFSGQESFYGGYSGAKPMAETIKMMEFGKAPAPMVRGMFAGMGAEDVRIMYEAPRTSLLSRVSTKMAYPSMFSVSGLSAISAPVSMPSRPSMPSLMTSALGSVSPSLYALSSSLSRASSGRPSAPSYKLFTDISKTVWGKSDLGTPFTPPSIPPGKTPFFTPALIPPYEPPSKTPSKVPPYSPPSLFPPSAPPSRPPYKLPPYMPPTWIQKPPVLPGGEWSYGTSETRRIGRSKLPFREVIPVISELFGKQPRRITARATRSRQVTSFEKQMREEIKPRRRKKRGK